MFIGLGLGLVAQAIYGGVGDNALNDYGTPFFLADFIESEYRNNGPLTSSFTALTGLTFTRASTGYAQTAAGVLVPFASGAPRITDKGLLIEGARTNLCLRSQEFDNASWSAVNLTSRTADAAAAPDGTTTADLIVPNTSNTAHNVNQSITHTAASYTYSVFAKAAGYAKLGFREATTLGSYATFDLSGAGSVIATLSATATIQALADGWYRCSFTFTGAAVAQQIGIFIMDSGYTSGSPHLYTYSGNGTSGAYLWGAQDELGAFPSSYIPTTTTSATRAADVASIAVSGLAYPVTMFAEFERVVDTATNEGLLGMGAGGGEFSEVMINTIDVARGVVQDGGAVQIDQSIGNTYALGVTGRMAMRVAANDCRIQGNGNAATDATATMPDAPTSIYIGTRGGSGSPSFGYLRRAAVYGRAFSDAELQSISA